ncbi:hypothetical protein [Anoxybacteroides tepidamans]|uniref:hypothetical protein n=1 Tax=Anoxybacteroides tepidamans TaxID=265948 RepID=UPI000483F69C|nr:hypothetical protein [Anoxybacillus tepidamans]
MRLILYWGVIVLSFGISLSVGLLQLKRKQQLFRSFFLAFFVNTAILAGGGIWWFFTETDGLSQGLGVLYYGAAAAIIAVVDLIVLSALRKTST